MFMIILRLKRRLKFANQCDYKTDTTLKYADDISVSTITVVFLIERDRSGSDKLF